LTFAEVGKGLVLEARYAIRLRKGPIDGIPAVRPDGDSVTVFVVGSREGKTLVEGVVAILGIGTSRRCDALAV